MTNRNRKTVDQKVRAVRIAFSREVSDDKMPKESGNSMKPSVETTLVDATNIAMLKEKNSSRLDVTSKEPSSGESNGDDLSKDKTTLLVVLPRKSFKKIVNVTENGDNQTMHS